MLACWGGAGGERSRNNEIYSSLILRLPEIRSASHPPPHPLPPPSICPCCLLGLKRKSLNHFIENISPCEKCPESSENSKPKRKFCVKTSIIFLQKGILRYPSATLPILLRFRKNFNCSVRKCIIKNQKTIFSPIFYSFLLC
jgi:hypothetical protein